MGCGARRGPKVSVMTDRTERLEIRRSADGTHHYVVKVGKNGEDLWTSEMYTRKATAQETAEREQASNKALEIVDAT